MTAPSETSGIDLYWLPLGAGGHFVKMNGRIYEFFQARHERRPALDLYHTALEVVVAEGRYVIENAWPIPAEDPSARGVTVQGPVGAPFLGHLRVFRYEVRRWRDGRIPDVAEAVASPQRLSDSEAHAHTLLALAERVPAYIWGRDAHHVGEMWNSNSVVAWLLTASGIDVSSIEPPTGGRAPGWMAGVTLAKGIRP